MIMATPIEQRGYARPEVLVSTDWVEQHLNDPHVRIIESNEDTLLYSSGHVPGAVHVDWTSDLNDQIRRDYITREGFEALMSRIGATPDTTVVFYGDKNNWWACYAFWVFQLFGHTNAKVMDGGRLKWEKEKKPTSRDVPSYANRPTSRRNGTTAPSRLSRRGARAPEGAGAARRRPQPRGVRRHPPPHAGLPERRGGPRRPHPGRQERPVGPRDQSRRRNVQDVRGVEEALSRGPEAVARQGDDRLLPHRRAQQPHLVRAEVSARVQARSATTTEVGRSGATW